MFSMITYLGRTGALAGAEKDRLFFSVITIAVFKLVVL